MNRLSPNCRRRQSDALGRERPVPKEGPMPEAYSVRLQEALRIAGADRFLLVRLQAGFP
jgi:hypothetical protein